MSIDFLEDLTNIQKFILELKLHNTQPETN